MSRWVRISTEIFDHEVFASSELSEREAWLWLIVKAAWRETHHRIGSVMVDVPRGSLFVTLRELRDAWRWKSDTRVRSFLEILQKERMIERTANAGKTQLTICNYDKYQNVERAENAPKTHEKRTKNALKIPIYQDNSLRSLSSAGSACENQKAENQDLKRSRSKGTRLSADWSAGEKNRADAIAAGVPVAKIEGIAQRFRDYWIAKAGKDGVKLDWDAAWRNWCSSEAEKRGWVATEAGSASPTATKTVFVAEGTTAWDAWCSELAARGKSYPPCRESRENGFKRGWYFPTEYPPSDNATSH